MNRNKKGYWLFRVVAILLGIALILFIGYLICGLIVNLSEDVPTTVNIMLSILSFTLAAISIIMVIITIKQNNKMLESTTRPYVVAYLVYQENSSHIYLCIKNFGKTSAIVKSLNIEPSFSLHNKTCNEVVNKIMLAPNQQMHFLLPTADKNRIVHGNELMFSADIVYKDCCTNKVYTESYNMNLEYVLTVLSTESSRTNLTSEQNSLRNIERILDYTKNNNM